MTTDEHYQRLLAVRTQLRRFDHWSTAAAGEHGLTHAQHQLLLVIRGWDDGRGPTIGDELGLVERVKEDADHRVVRLRLTPPGRHIVEALAQTHLEELRRLSKFLEDLTS